MLYIYIIAKDNFIHNINNVNVYIFIYFAIQIFGVSKIFLYFIYTFIQQECINLIKSESKYSYNATKYLYLD